VASCVLRRAVSGDDIFLILLYRLCHCRYRAVPWDEVVLLRREKEPLASELRDNGNTRDLYPQCGGAFNGVQWARVFEERTSPEPAVPGVFGFRMVVPPSEYALPGVGSFGAEGAGPTRVCSAFEEVRRLHFMVSFGAILLYFASSFLYRVFILQAFDRLRSELLHHGAKLRKILDEGESLRLLGVEKEVALMH